MPRWCSWSSGCSRWRRGLALMRCGSRCPRAVGRWHALYGVELSLLVERSLRAGPLHLSGWRWLLLLPLAPLLLAGPFGVGALVITVVVYANRSGRLLELWHSTVVTWVGRAAVAGVTVYSGAVLVSDAAEIL
jgi:hypothetical protein